MQSLLEQILSGNVLAFLLVFARLGAVITVMPGIGDSYVSPRVRLMFALAFSFVVYPMIIPYVPEVIPPTHKLALLIIYEVIIGLMVGAVIRIFMLALDTGGMVISMQSGLGNAQVLNPALSSQGSLIGTFFTLVGVVLIFVTNLHHMLLAGAIESYQLFPIGGLPDTGSMADLIASSVSASFLIGLEMGMPFIVLTLLVYVAMGVMARLMPQIQVFMVVIPLQIIVSFVLLSLALTALFYHWITKYEAAIFFFFSNGVGVQ